MPFNRPQLPEHPVEEGVARIIKQIVNVFETGKAHGDYGLAVVLDDGAGISYGRSQATDGGGNLDRIVYAYRDAGGEYADALRPYLDRLANDASARVDPASLPEWTVDLMNLLAKAGRTDPIMQNVQDAIFDEAYWLPAVNQADEMQLELPLSLAVVYDSTIHSGPFGVARIRRMFPEMPPSRDGDERAWTTAYVRARYAWLANHPRYAVRQTVYRMRAFLQLIEDNNWNLEVPFTIPRPRVTITGP